MDIAIELQVTQNLVKAGFFTEKEIQADFELHQICQQRKLQLSLIQVVLEKHARDVQSRRDLLMSIVKELEIPEIRDQIDPYGMELGRSWEEKLAKRKRDLETDSLAKKADNYRSELKKYGLDFSREHVALLMGDIPDLWDKGNEHLYAKNKQIDLKHFCERSRNREFFPWNSPVFKISGNMLRMGDIQKALDLQKKLNKSLELNVPIAHILIGLYQVEAYFLHTLLIAQMDCEEEEVSSWWGGMSLGSFKLSPDALDSLKQIQPYCERFLEGCFQTAWLEFDPKNEFALVEHFEKKLPQNTLKEARKIQKDLEGLNLSLSFLKVLAFSGAVTSTQLLEGVLRHVYQIEVKVVDQSKQKKKMELGQTMPVSRKDLAKKIPAKVKTVEPVQKKRVAIDKKSLGTDHLKSPGKASAKTKKPARPLPSGGLGQTMALSQEHLVKKIKDAPRAASKIMERLMQRERERERTKEPEPQEKPQEKEVPKAPSTKKIPTVTMSIDEDIERVRKGLAENMISESEIFDAVMIQAAKGNKKLLDVLQEEKLITKEQYTQLRIVKAIEQKIDVVKPSQARDLMLANLLIDYQIINRDQVQRTLRLQNTFACLGFIYSLGSLLIKTKTLAAEMVDPLLAECERREKEKAAAASGIESAKDLPKELTSKTRVRNNTWAIIGTLATVFFIAWIAWPSTPKRPPISKNQPTRQPVAPVASHADTGVDRTEKADTRPPKSKHSRKKTVATPVPKLPEVSAINFVLKDVAVDYNDRQLKLKGVFAHNLSKKRIKDVKVAVEIWDLWKQERYLLEEFELSDNAFKRSVSTEAVLARGLYYLRFTAILPGAKHDSWEYWQPFSVGFSLRQDKKIREWGDDNFRKMEKDLTEVREQYDKLYKFCRRPLGEIEKKWEDWSKKWRKKNRNLSIRCRKRKSENLLPFCETIDNGLLELLADLKPLENGLNDWQQGLSLLPPNMLFRESRFIARQKRVDKLLKQRKKLFRGLVRVKKIK